MTREEREWEIEDKTLSLSINETNFISKDCDLKLYVGTRW